MRKFLVIAALLLAGFVSACDRPPSSSDVQRERQEKVVSEGVAQTGVPSITKFRELKLLKLIYELRDQEGLVTYTYVENLVPTVAKGITAFGGKFSFLCDSVGYPIPYATQYSAPTSMQRYRLPSAGDGSGVVYGTQQLPQAEPNGLFMPSSAEGTWVICKDPDSDKVGPVYVEPKLSSFPYKLKVD